MSATTNVLTLREIVGCLRAAPAAPGKYRFSCTLHGGVLSSGSIAVHNDTLSLRCVSGCNFTCQVEEAVNRLPHLAHLRPKVLTKEEMDRRGLKFDYKPLPKPLEAHDRRELIAELNGETSDAGLQSEIARLAALPIAEYGQCRKSESKRLSVPVAILDTAVKDARKAKPGAAGSDGGQGKAIMLTDPEPLPEAEACELDGASLLQEVSDLFTSYLTLPDHAPTVLALWTVFTWVHDAFRVSPLLAVTSPERECGKTTLLSLLCAVVRKPFPSANATASSMFRLVDQHAPTILADEVDKWLRRDDERMGLINSGWARHLATFTRTEGDKHEVRSFSTWAPKALAGILTLPEEIAGRSIEIRMRRQTRAEGSRLKSLRADAMSGFEPLRRKLYTWTQGVVAEGTLPMRNPELPEGFTGRLADNWHVLAAIAQTAGEEWPERCFDAATAFVAKGRESSWGEQLLRDIGALFDDSQTDRLLLGKITAHLVQMEERPWGECSHGRAMSTHWLSRKLAGYNIPSKDVRTNAGKGNGYFREQFEEAIERYCGKNDKPAKENAQNF